MYMGTDQKSEDGLWGDRKEKRNEKHLKEKVILNER